MCHEPLSLFCSRRFQDYDPSEENPGTAPFSEPETQIMRKLAISFDPHIWINVHSGMEVMFLFCFSIIMYTYNVGNTALNFCWSMSKHVNSGFTDVYIL
jgi:hypothetical protein